MKTNYDEKLLFKLVEDVRKGDVVKITYCFDDKLSNYYNTILITDDKNGLKAVWYDDKDYKGLPYIILDYQIITEIVKRNINIEEYFESTEIKQHDSAKKDESFLRKE